MKKKIVALIGITLLMFISINILSVPIQCYSMDNYISSEKDINTNETENSDSNNISNKSSIKYKATESTIYIYWTVMDSALDYEVEVDGNVAKTGGDTLYVHEGLEPNSTHKYRIRAVYENETSPWSDYFEITTAQVSTENGLSGEELKNSLYDSIKDFEATVEETIPLVPEGICIFSNNDSIIIAWDNSKGAKEYDIEKDGVIVASTNNSVYKDENLQYGEKHSYRVRAKNTLGVSEWSNYVEEKISNGFIRLPQNINLKCDSNSITISWDKVENVTGYEIEIDGEQGQVVTDSFFVHDNLKEKESHYYRVRAIRGDLLGNWSKIYFDKTLEAVEENKDDKENSLEEVCEEEKDNIENKEEIASNELGKLKNKEDINSGVSLPSTENIEEDNSNIEEKNVLDGEENKLNEGKSEEELVEKVTKVTIPNNINYESTENSISLCWDEVTGATSYEVEVDGNILSISDSEYTFSNLKSGTEHTFRVRALGDNSTSEWSELVKVNTLIGDLTINENMTLSEDIICNNLYVNSETLNLNGYKLIILGNYVQNGANLHIQKGSLIVNGNYDILGDSNLLMEYSEDRVVVNGDFTIGSETCGYYNFKNGVLEVKGNVIQKVGNENNRKNNFYQTNNFILKLTGDEKVVVSIETPNESCFNVLDISESAGVEFTVNGNIISPKVFIGIDRVLGKIEIQNSKIEIVNNSIVNSEVQVSNNSIINLQGYTLTTKSTLLGSKIVININKGKLIVLEDYIQEDTKIYLNSGEMILNNNYIIKGNSLLLMQYYNDKVQVNGNFSMLSTNSSEGYLRNGILEVKGNITQKSVDGYGYSKYNFNQTGNFILKISGDNVSTISIESPYTSSFNIIDSTESAGVIFKNVVKINNIDKLKNVKSSLIIDQSNLVLGVDLFFEKYVRIDNSNINFNEHKVVFENNMCQNSSKININRGNLIVNGSYSIKGYSLLIMEYKDDKVEVNGNFYMSSSNSSEGYLTNGTLEIKGNIYQSCVEGNSNSQYNFKQTKNFVLKISGDNVSQIRVTNPIQSSFNIIDSRSCGGVKFCTKIRLTTFKNLENVDGGVNLYYSHIKLDDYYDLNYNVTLTNSILEFNDYDLYIAKKLTLIEATVKLCGAYLYVDGDLRQKGGTVDISGGYLSIGGNYTISDGAWFIMTDEDDYVYVSGKFTIATTMSEEGRLTNGVLAIGGDFLQKGDEYSFAASDNHEVIFVGSKLHNVTFSNTSTSNFAKVDFDSYSCIKFIDLEGCTIGSVLSNFCLGLKDSIVDSCTDLWDTLCNLDKIPESIAFIVKALLPWSTEQSELINQLSETIEGFINEMYFSNANIIARKVGKIVGDVIISIIVDKGVKFIVQGLKGLIKSDKLATILNKIDNVDDTGKISDDTAKEISDGIDVEIRSNAYITGGVGNLSRREELLAKVSNQKLKNCINEMYRKGATIGDGGLADAVRYELKTGELVGGKSHMKKAVERVKNLENIINKQNLSKNDLDIAQRLLDDLKNAINGK